MRVTTGRAQASDDVNCRAMKRVRLSFMVACLLSAAALGQEHKISVQKFEPPVYPQIARQARITGEVKLALNVAADGSVTDVKVLSGHPMLIQSAITSVKKWKFHCVDCAYGEAFRHEFTVGFKLANFDCNSGFWNTDYEFPNKVILTRTLPCIDTAVSY
jgi:TonB family protein